MSVSLPRAFEVALSAIESTPTYINGRAFSVELERSSPDPSALSDAERRGCIAEIIGHRFVAIPSSDRDPWDSYFGPVTSGVDQDGNPVYFPDATKIEETVIQYWISRSERTMHPILRARYADLAWEVGRIWNRGHPGGTQIPLPREIAQRAANAYIESIKLLDPVEPLKLHEAWQFLGRALSLALSIKDQALVDRVKDLAFDFNRANRKAGRLAQWWQVDDFAFDRKGLVLSEAERTELLRWLQESLDRRLST